MNNNSHSLTTIFAFGGAAVVAFAYFYLSRPEHEPIPEISSEKLLLILEDMRIQYTPYYNHYYQLLCALDQEYSSKPNIRGKIKGKIADKLEERTLEIQQAIVEKYMIDGGTQSLGLAITYHSKSCEEVNRIARLFQQNEDKLLRRNPVEKPDFELQFQHHLSKKVYNQIVRKVFGCLRHKIYKEIRQIVRNRQIGQDVYLTRNEATDVLSDINIKDIRTQVFHLYGLEYEERSLIKAYYSFMNDKVFTESIRQAKQSHERYMTAILSCDVFPGLDRTDPMSSPDDDLIPEKFGPNWFEHREPKKFALINNNDDLSDDVFDTIDAEVTEELNEMGGSQLMETN